jgi:hypothetical protein
MQGADSRMRNGGIDIRMNGRRLAGQEAETLFYTVAMIGVG